MAKEFGICIACGRSESVFFLMTHLHGPGAKHCSSISIGGARALF